MMMRCLELVTNKLCLATVQLSWRKIELLMADASVGAELMRRGWLASLNIGQSLKITRPAY